MKFQVRQLITAIPGSWRFACKAGYRLQIITLISLSIFLSGCGERFGTFTTVKPIAFSLPAALPIKPAAILFFTTPVPTLTPENIVIGPDAYPSDVNPLTGEKVEDPKLLELPPALVSVSNSPVTARPQSGLSNASIVYELYIGNGVTRFLAIYYGNYPPKMIVNEEGEEYLVEIGPIRSGRLPYESLRLLHKGFLVFASASSRVLPYLSEYYLVFGDTNANSVNTARISVSHLLTLAQDWKTRLGQPHLYGLKFDNQTPLEGKKGIGIWIPYHYTDQVFWRYEPQERVYLRYQDTEDGVTVVPHIDRLSGQTLAFENVIVMFANYTFYDTSLFDIDLMYITRNPALLFRNGRMYEVYWTTGNTNYERNTGRLRPIRFVDSKGDPVSLQPGRTWIEIVPLYTNYREVKDS